MNNSFKLKNKPVSLNKETYGLVYDLRNEFTLEDFKKDMETFKENGLINNLDYIITHIKMHFKHIESDCVEYFKDFTICV